ncbi:type I-E CRISPR-associated protein Cas6/Cse3/CasE [Streptomyces anulatus]|uniref:type I-E CRISPR-associated protein Cas6/Cse3/CasE n=1 Tax=Streptomyces anulatus TaxID=1892 RepID=UPI001C26C0A0|nr:type I-E CRISPR-associated protein Cas6/Cse3/CasE [Streptomyces anulatus]
MSHLTRCTLNPARAHHLTASPQRLHAAVASAFPPPSSGEEPSHRVLWRLDETRQPHRQPVLLIVSSMRPDLTHVIEQAGWPRLATPEKPGWETRSYAPVLNALRPGLRLRFRLTANPSRAAFHRGRRGVRTAASTPAERIQWLLDRAPRAGFGIAPQSEQDHRPNVTVARHQVLDFARTPGGQHGQNVHLHTATYEGDLDVTDPDALRHTLTQGIGRAKGYGCGLLTLAPAPQPD